MTLPRRQQRQNLFFLISSIIVFIIGWSSYFTETIYFNGLYNWLGVALRFASGKVPFAIGDFLYIVFATWLLWQFYHTFKLTKNHNKRGQIVLNKAINMLLTIYLSFKILWGLNYSRPTIAKQLNIGNAKYNPTQLVALGNFFLDTLNHIRAEIEQQQQRPKHYNIQQLQTIATKAYATMEQKNKIFRYQQPAIKPVLFTHTVTKMGIEGYYNLLSGEANVNMMLPTFVLPFTVCHEMAHQTGIAKEDEANLIGFLTAAHSQDINFRYAAFYAVFRSILWEIRINAPATYDGLYKKISVLVLADFNAENKFWQRYNSNMSKYLGTAFDQLLKLNHQQKGIKSYQDIVLWVYNYYK